MKGFRKTRKLHKKQLLILAIFLVIGLTIFSSSVTARAEGDENENQNTTIEDIVDEVDLSPLEEFISSLDESQKGLFKEASFKERIKKIISGEIELDYTSFLAYLAELAGLNILQFLPMIMSILVISISFNIISSVKGKFASDSVESIVHFASISLVVVIVLSQFIILMTQALKMISSMQSQMNAVFPVILTMMAATGAVKSAAVYQPSVAILSGGVSEIVTSVIFPCIILTTVFTVVGSISEGVKLKKMASFFSSASKWLLGTLFFVFMAFLSIQGITASVYDGVSVRTAKFAVSKYVPIIGGYLSEGLNLVMAGSVLVKNAVGMTAVILLFLTLAPLLIKIIIFSLSLSITAGIVEPLGNSKISSLMSDLAKNVSSLIAVVLGTAFLYFIFLILVISTGNLIL